MKTTEIKYTKRFNVGPYEHEEYSLTAVMDEEDGTGAEHGLVSLKTMVKNAHAEGAPAQEDLPPAGESMDAESASKKVPKKSKKSKAKEEESASDDTMEDESDDVDAESEDNSDADAESDDDDNADDSEDEQENEAPPKKAPKKSKKTGGAYSRSNEIHKKLFAAELKKINEGWFKNPKLKAKAQAMSKKLDGKDFLDANGKVIPEFKAELKKGMK